MPFGFVAAGRQFERVVSAGTGLPHCVWTACSNFPLLVCGNVVVVLVVINAVVVTVVFS